MKLNPIIPEREDLQDSLWPIVEPDTAEQIEAELADQKFTFYNECCYNLPIDAYITPSLHMLCRSIKERLNVTDKVIFHIDNRARVTGSSLVSGNKTYPCIVSLSSGAVNTLNEKELSFLIGHELGHIISRCGLVRFFFKKFFSKDSESYPMLAHDLHVLDLLSELEADRYGFLACDGDMDAFISFMYKLSGGVGRQKFGVSNSTFLNANMRHVQKFMNGGWLGDKHPANALRIEAIRLFATCKTNRELQSQMKPIIDSICNCDD